MSATDIGINFRGTSGYVTDGADETYALAADSYPTSRGGWTFGLVSGSVTYFNRNSGVDRRFAGAMFATFASGTVDFRVDLPATGDYDIHVIAADSQDNTTDRTSQLSYRDNTTEFATSGPTTIKGGCRYVADAAGTQFGDGSALNSGITGWQASEAAISRTFVSTIFIVRVAAVTSNWLSHLRVVQTGGGGGSAVPRGSLMLMGMGA